MSNSYVRSERYEQGVVDILCHGVRHHELSSDELLEWAERCAPGYGVSPTDSWSLVEAGILRWTMETLSASSTEFLRARLQDLDSGTIKDDPQGRFRKMVLEELARRN